jgi:hypothetical protein
MPAIIGHWPGSEQRISIPVRFPSQLIWSFEQLFPIGKKCFRIGEPEHPLLVEVRIVTCQIARGQLDAFIPIGMKALEPA